MSNATGVDISVWSDLNSTAQMFDPLKARQMGASFVGIKASQGKWTDPDFVQNWANCKNKLYRMPYHFLVWDISAKLQAEYFWSLIEPDTLGILPLMADFEWWQTTPPDAMDILYNFVYRLTQLAGPLPVGIYTNYYYWQQHGTQSDYWKQFALWLCDITGPVIEMPKPWETWTFHQYTFKLDGPAWGAESAGLDGDYYNGTLEQMVQRYGLPPLDDMPVTPDPVPSAALYMRAQRFVNVRAAATTASADLGDVLPGELVGPIVGIAGGQTGAWAHLANGTYVCAADQNNIVYLVEK
jgi:lysozyme